MPVPRMPQLEQQLVQKFQISPFKTSFGGFMGFPQRLRQRINGALSFLRNPDKYDTSILFTSEALHHSRSLQPVHQPGHVRRHCCHAPCYFPDGYTVLVLHLKNLQHVELGLCDPVRFEDLRKLALQPFRGSYEVKEQFLFKGIEGTIPPNLFRQVLRFPADSLHGQNIRYNIIRCNMYFDTNVSCAFFLREKEPEKGKRCMFGIAEDGTGEFQLGMSGPQQKSGTFFKEKSRFWSMAPLRGRT